MTPFTQPQDRVQVYSDPVAGFAVDVPAGWIVDASGRQNTRVILLHPRQDLGFQPNVNVLVQDLRGLSAEEYLTMSRLQLRFLAGLPKLDRDESVVRTPGAHVFEWTMAANDLALRASQMMVLSKSRAYHVTATALAIGFNDCRRDFDAIQESFALLQHRMDALQ